MKLFHKSKLIYDIVIWLCVILSAVCVGIIIYNKYFNKAIYKVASFYYIVYKQETTCLE